MTARTGMTDIIAELRSLTDAGTAEFTIGTVSFWNDDTLQSVLDSHRVDIDSYSLIPNPRYEAGTLTYKEYRSVYKWLESGTAALTVQNGLNVEVGTAAYTVDCQRGVVTFGTDTKGSSYYLYGRTYNLYAAAADVWERKAAHVAIKFDFSTDNHSIKRSQLYENYMKQSDRYALLANSMTGSIDYERGDTRQEYHHDRD